MERSRKQNEDGIKSIKVADGIGNLEENRECLNSLDVWGGTSAKGARRSRDVKCRRRHRRERMEAGRPLNASIFDHYTEK
jgi:hypothetical protein